MDVDRVAELTLRVAALMTRVVELERQFARHHQHACEICVAWRGEGARDGAGGRE